MDVFNKEWDSLTEDDRITIKTIVAKYSKVLDTACKRYKIENPIRFEDYLDLAEVYKLMKGDNYTTGLKAATEEQNVDTAGLWHTAFDDANNTGKLLKKLVENGWKPESYFESIKEVKQYFCREAEFVVIFLKKVC